MRRLLESLIVPVQVTNVKGKRYNLNKGGSLIVAELTKELSVQLGKNTTFIPSLRVTCYKLSDHVTMKPHYIRPTLTGARPLSTRIETHPKHNLIQPKQSFNL